MLPDVCHCSISQFIGKGTGKILAEVKNIWEDFPHIKQRVRVTHEAVGLASHHHWMVAMRVGNLAKKIALDQWKNMDIALLAGIAGMCSNVIHIIMKRDKLENRSDVTPEARWALVTEWMGEFMIEQLQAVNEALIRKEGLNEKDDPNVSIALHDAIRVTGLDFDLFMRSGALHNKLPAFDYRFGINAKGVTYREPGTIFRDIAYSLDWVKEGSPVCCRTRLGMELAQKRAVVFTAGLTAFYEQLEEEGVWPYPFEAQEE